jgi:hypothetical protein
MTRCLTAASHRRYETAVAFDDIAKRMKAERGLTRGERLRQIWTGEEPELPPLPDAIQPAAPAARTKTLVGAYALLGLGLVVVFAGVAGLLLFWSVISRWEVRGLMFVIAIGIALVVQSTRLFTAADQTKPLPNARVR